MFADLNPEQRAAATAQDDVLLVLAGAGTGKTTTLCARVVHLLAEGLAPERVLLLTFTRRAAREMVERAHTLVERHAPACARIAGGTFHSVANRVVRLHAASLGLDAGFGLLDASDAADLLDMIREPFGIRRFPRAQTMLDIYSRVVNAQQPLAEVLGGSFPWCAEHLEPLAEAFRAYSARKRELGVLDLDDLLLCWRALLDDEVIGPGIARSYEHVLVDEYQDVNGLQVDIVEGLCRAGASLTAVGDDFQAIYGFRAASARHILDFADRFPGARTIVLERNYRSGSEILAVANAVSEQDRNGYRKRLWSERSGNLRPELVLPLDDAGQAREVCERVLAAREEDIELRCQAVLFRTGHDSDLLELELARRAIPYVKYGGLRFFDAAHVKDLIAVLRLVENPGDELSWFRVLQLCDGVGPSRAWRALEALRSGGEGGARAGRPRLANSERALEHVPGSSRAHARALLAALAEVSALHGSQQRGPAPASSTGAQARPGAAAAVERLCGALAPLLHTRYPDGAARVADLERLSVAARAAPDLGVFVSELVLDPPSSSADLAGPPHLDEDYLVLSTVHSAKGLEWDVVHVIGVYDGNFPADMNTGGEEGIAEERRVFYVALTRARRRLHLYVPERYYHHARGSADAHGLGRPSRFLTPAVRSLLETTRPPAPGLAGDGAGCGDGAHHGEGADHADGARHGEGADHGDRAHHGEDRRAGARGARTPPARRVEVSVEGLFG